MSHVESQSRLNRRDVLVAAGAGAIAVAGVAATSRTALAAPADADKYQAELTGGAAATEGKVTVKMPAIAENGNTVPFTVMVDSPMTADNYVKAVHVMAEDNPTPQVCSYHLTPECGKVDIRLTMRLAKTQDVRAVAVMSDGSVFTGKANVKVTIGGCGG